jgi:hypothetical protein
MGVAGCCAGATIAARQQNAQIAKKRIRSRDFGMDTTMPHLRQVVDSFGVSGILPA